MHRELRNKILFTIALVIAYRFTIRIPLPPVEPGLLETIGVVANIALATRAIFILVARLSPADD